MNILSQSQRLYQRPTLEELSVAMATKKGFSVVDVPEKGVDVEGREGSNLGVTRFDRKEIYRAMMLPKAVGDYVLGHEAFVEAHGHPNGAENHAILEKEYLENLKNDGYMNEYLAGVAMHYIRNKAGNTAPFRWIRKYVDNAVDKYKDSEAFQYHMANIDKVLRNKESPDFKPSLVDRGYKAGKKMGKGIAEKGIGKYIMDFAAEKLEKISAKYKPVMEPAMEVG